MKKITLKYFILKRAKKVNDSKRCTQVQLKFSMDAKKRKITQCESEVKEVMDSEKGFKSQVEATAKKLQTAQELRAFLSDLVGMLRAKENDIKSHKEKVLKDVQRRSVLMSRRRRIIDQEDVVCGLFKAGVIKSAVNDNESSHYLPTAAMAVVSSTELATHTAYVQKAFKIREETRVRARSKLLEAVVFTPHTRYNNSNNTHESKNHAKIEIQESFGKNGYTHEVELCMKRRNTTQNGGLSNDLLISLQSSGDSSQSTPDTADTSTVVVGGVGERIDAPLKLPDNQSLDNNQSSQQMEMFLLMLQLEDKIYERYHSITYYSDSALLYSTKHDSNTANELVSTDIDSVVASCDALLSDVEDEVYSVPILIAKLTALRTAYTEKYAAAYVSLSLPELLLPMVSLDLMRLSSSLFPDEQQRQSQSIINNHSLSGNNKEDDDYQMMNMYGNEMGIGFGSKQTGGLGWSAQNTATGAPGVPGDEVVQPVVVRLLQDAAALFESSQESEEIPAVESIWGKLARQLLGNTETSNNNNNNNDDEEEDNYSGGVQFSIASRVWHEPLRVFSNEADEINENNDKQVKETKEGEEEAEDDSDLLPKLVNVTVLPWAQDLISIAFDAQSRLHCRQCKHLLAELLDYDPTPEQFAPLVATVADAFSQQVTDIYIPVLDIDQLLCQLRGDTISVVGGVNNSSETGGGGGIGGSSYTVHPPVHPPVPPPAPPKRVVYTMNMNNPTGKMAFQEENDTNHPTSEKDEETNNSNNSNSVPKTECIASILSSSLWEGGANNPYNTLRRAIGFYTHQLGRLLLVLENLSAFDQYLASDAMVSVTWRIFATKALPGVLTLLTITEENLLSNNNPKQSNTPHYGLLVKKWPSIRTLSYQLSLRICVLVSSVLTAADNETTQGINKQSSTTTSKTGGALEAAHVPMIGYKLLKVFVDRLLSNGTNTSTAVVANNHNVISSKRVELLQVLQRIQGLIGNKK